MVSTEKLQWSIGTQGGDRISFRMMSEPTSKETEGYDWIEAKVDLCMGSFNCQTGLTLTVTDIVRFRDQIALLNQELKGAAVFSTIENQIGFRLEADQLGHMHLTGFLRDDVSSDNELSFACVLDQTHLAATIAEIDVLLRELESRFSASGGE